MKSALRSHLKNNTGDAFVLFLMLLISVLLIMSATMALMAVRIRAKGICNQVENSADFVVSNIKADAYQTLIHGTTENTDTDYDEEDVIAWLVEALSVDENSVAEGHIVKKDENSRTLYELYDFELEIVDNEGSREIKFTFTIDVPVYINGSLVYTYRDMYTKITKFNIENRGE